MKSRFVLVMTVLMLSILACNLGNATSTPAASSSDTPSPSATNPPPTSAPTVLTSSCSNNFYPVIAGTSWNYSSSGSLAGSYTFTRSILEVRSDGFTDQDIFAAGTTRTSDWKCDAGNLTELNPGSGAGSVSTSSSTMVVDSMQSDGITIPANMEAGATWSQNTKIKGTMVINSVTAQATNDYNQSCTSQGVESVTVPAGTFDDAVKVSCTAHFTITVNVNGIEVPTNLDTQSTSWYAPNVGWVKSVTDLGAGGTETIELTSYTLP